ncbi:MAG: hypothetical protein QNJ41_18165 [Xenococcaceae cyanobacterium MO_188.B32]|nr:hypothetical protein [Xenococcaceae cyanobacterium MO_188.B32]
MSIKIEMMNNISPIDSIFVASLLFLVGSAIFTFEAILEIRRSTSIMSFAHFLACLFFTIGSFLFLHNARK